MTLKRPKWIGAAALLALATSCTFSNPTSASEITPVKDKRALAELKTMADALSGAKSMSFSATTMTPLRGPNDQWVHVFSTARVELQRPNRLFVDTGGDVFPHQIYFDGKSLSVSAPDKKVYTQNDVSGSIDDALAQSSSKGGNSLPFADLLIADPYGSWTQDLNGAVYVGESTRGGEKLRHIALTAKNVDWEMWVSEKDHLPRMVFVKYTGENRSPSVLLEFSKWKLNASLAAADFVFHAPKGTQKVSLKAPEGASK